MKALMLFVALLLAGCAHNQGVHLNDGRWQEHNSNKQRACVLRIIEIAPPSATREELDYNLKLCMLHNDVFI